MIIVIILILLFLLWNCHRNINFDANATTTPGLSTIMHINSSYWLGNPSAFYSHAGEKIKELQNLVLGILGKKNHKCIITSSASESNNLLMRGYSGNGRRACSKWEHKTTLGCVDIITENLNELQSGDIYSHMYCNNETGNIFDVKKIAADCHRRGIIFHTDAAQFFGKSENPIADFEGIDFITISLHKMYGPIGVGLLIIPADYYLKPQIIGVQNDGLRGGTENVPAIVGSICAIKNTLDNRHQKNQKLKYLCDQFKKVLLKYRDEMKMDEFIGRGEIEALKKCTGGCKNKVVFLSENSINTVLVSFVNNANNLTKGDRFCNIKFREELTKLGIQVSIGSACNTGVQGPSHVLLAMKLPFIIRCGVIRFSFSDNNTIFDLWEFERRAGDLLY